MPATAARILPVADNAAAAAPVLTATAPGLQTAGMKHLLLLAVSLRLLGAADPAPADAVILHEAFSDPAAVATTWRGPGSVDDGGWCIVLPTVGTAKASTGLPAERIAGKQIRLSARIRSEAVSTRPEKWNGIKVQLILTDAAGGKQYPQLSTSDGTQAWTPLSQLLTIPAEVVKADLVIGLENVSGSVWFDDLRLETVTITAP